MIFDQKLQWTDQIAHCIAKSNRSLVAIKMIKKYFNTSELLMFVTSNFYSILFYNSEIWHLPTLKHNLKQKLLSSSAKAIKVCVNYFTSDVSFDNLHAMYHRATPEKVLLYKLALSLFKIYNSNFNSIEFVMLNFNQIFTSRQTKFITSKSTHSKIGLNSLANRFYALNNKIPLDWLNHSFVTYKVKCKNLFLK